MHNNLAGVLNLLLAQPQLGNDMQQRVLAHGIRSKDYHLLARLAAHPNLHPDVDRQLSAVNSALVKIAWIGRKGRTVEEISDMVRSEKRVTVLTALAESEGLPDDLYRNLVERTDNTTVLVAVQSNQKIDKEIRLQSAAKQISLLGSPRDHDERVDTDHISNIGQIIRRNKAVAGRLFSSNDIHILMALAHSVEMPADAQLRLAKKFSKRYEKLITVKKDYGYYNNPVSHVIELVDSMVEHGTIDEQAAKILDEMLVTLRANAVGYMQNRIDTQRVGLGQSKPEGVRRLQERIEQVDSADAMTSMVNDINSMHASSKLDFPDRLLPDVALGVIASEHADLAAVTTVCGWFTWGFDPLRAIQAADRNDSARIATVINNVNHVDIDEALDLVANPAEVMEHLVASAAKEEGRFSSRAHEVLRSKHFTPDMIRRMPLFRLLETSLDEKFVNLIETELRDNLDNDEAWNTFATLADEFSGSFGELVNISRTL